MIINHYCLNKTQIYAKLDSKIEHITLIIFLPSQSQFGGF
jgi:hypothetical protein